MRIEPVGVAPSNVYIPEIEPSREKLGAVDITPILPKSDKPATLWDIVSPAKSPFADLFNILDNIVFYPEESMIYKKIMAKILFHIQKPYQIFQI